MSTTKTCNKCKESKPYDPSHKNGTKANGFDRNTCYICKKESHVVYMREKYRPKKSSELNMLESTVKLASIFNKWR